MSTERRTYSRARLLNAAGQLINPATEEGLSALGDKIDSQTDAGATEATLQEVLVALRPPVAPPSKGTLLHRV